MVGNLLESLKKLAEWQRIVAMADKVPDLERRIQALEREKLAAASPHATCPSCGLGRWRKVSSARSKGPFGKLGALDVTYACTSCQFTETKLEH